MKPQRKSDLLTVKLTPAMRAEVEKAAKTRDVGLSEIVRVFLEDGLRRDGIVRGLEC
jgi:hypothetical protein